MPKGSKAQMGLGALESEYTDVEIPTIYPKSIEMDELYGKQLSENTYAEGLLPFHLRELCNNRYTDEDSARLQNARIRWSS